MTFDKPGNQNAGQSHYRKQEHNRSPVRCPKCGKMAREVQTRYGLRSDCCGMWSWHRWPLQTKEHHDAKRAAHAVFDKLWKSGLVSRNKAYRELSDRLGRQAHMKEMTLDELLKVPLWVEDIREHELAANGEPHGGAR